MTKIEWTRNDDGSEGKTWNPIRGCSRVSPGCVHCYAERQAIRHAGPGGHYAGLVKAGVDGSPRWTGTVRLVSEKLDEPLRWRKPRRVFANSMSDAFHEALDEAQIARVLAYAIAAILLRGHTMQILTKRAERMHRLLTRPGFWDPIAREAVALVELYGAALEPKRRIELLGVVSRGIVPGLWIIVSAEDQQRADERIPLLRQTPAAVRGVSLEPLLGPVDVERYLRRMVVGGADVLTDAMVDAGWSHPGGDGDHPRLNWVIVGGESGPGARPADVAWIRSIVEQCRAASVPVFVKQLGAHVISNGCTGPGEHWPSGTKHEDTYRGHWRHHLRDRKGGAMEQWPEDLRVREWPATP